MTPPAGNAGHFPVKLGRIRHPPTGVVPTQHDAFPFTEIPVEHRPAEMGNLGTGRNYRQTMFPFSSQPKIRLPKIPRQQGVTVGIMDAKSEKAINGEEIEKFLIMGLIECSDIRWVAMKLQRGKDTSLKGDRFQLL